MERRAFAALSAIGLAIPSLGRAASAGNRTRGDRRPSASSTFPAQDPSVVREIVAVSHGNLERVRELVGEVPELAKATWDWGFGDWESALGAASHTGRREIAMVLLEHGARPSLFSAAMLGQLDVVRACIEASPGIQRTPGPHGITLLSHARAGGEPAADVAAYLEDVGDADVGPVAVPLGDGVVAGLLGAYRYGEALDEVLEVTDRDGTAFIGRVGHSPRGLTHLGDLAFHPAGAPSVRIIFEAGAAVPTVRVVAGSLTIVAEGEEAR